VKKSVVAAVCDRRVLFISMDSSALIERRYNSFTASEKGIGKYQEREETLIQKVKRLTQEEREYR
jgi:hypothetical protein